MGYLSRCSAGFGSRSSRCPPSFLQPHARQSIASRPRRHCSFAPKVADEAARAYEFGGPQEFEQIPTRTDGTSHGRSISRFRTVRRPLFHNQIGAARQFAGLYGPESRVHAIIEANACAQIHVERIRLGPALPSFLSRWVTRNHGVSITQCGSGSHRSGWLSGSRSSLRKVVIVRQLRREIAPTRRRRLTS
jgi:hypothetical protein